MTSESTATSLDAYADLVRARRTHLLMDRERAVPVALVEELCELATWAPNHKHTWPWRFALFTGDGRERLGAAFADDMRERTVGDAAKHDKTRTKYMRAPAIVVAGAVPHIDPTYDEENRFAVAAGIQTLLLGATAAGLASFWSTPPLADPDRVLELCGFEPGDRLLGVIYLGWPTGTTDAPERPDTTLTHVDR